MLIRTITSLFLASLVSISVSAQDMDISLASDGRIFTEMDVNGQPVSFLFDTAAKRIGMKQIKAEQLGIMPQTGKTITHFSVMGALRLPATNVKKGVFPYDRLTYSWVAHYPSYGELDATLGFELFTNRLLHIQPKLGKMTVHNRSATFTDQGFQILSGQATYFGGLLLLVDVKGLRTKVLVGTGTNVSLINWKLKEHLMSLEGVKPTKRLVFANIGMEPNSRERPGLVVPDFNLGDWKLGDMIVASVNTEKMGHYGTNQYPYMILGADVLGREETVLDLRGLQLWYKPKEQ